MPQCKDCQRHEVPEPSALCPYCQDSHFERVALPLVRAVCAQALPLARKEDPTSLFQAWYELVTTLARIPIAPDRFAPSQTPLASQVATEAAIWKAYRPAIARYQQQVSLEASAWEFLKLLGDAHEQREDCACLLTQFGIDVQQGIYDNYDKLPPSDKPRGLSALLDYWKQQAIVHSCAWAVRTAQQAGYDLQHTLQAAVLAMREAVFDGIAQQSIWLHMLARHARPEITTCLLSGWVRPQIRMYPSHRMVLSEFGDPRTVLGEWLPGWIWDATHNGVQTPSELLKAVRHRLDEARPKSSRRTRSTSQSQGQSAPRSRRQSQSRALEIWQAQEALRLDASVSNVLKENAKLSPKQALVWELRQQGWKIREIAAKRGVNIGTIKTEIFRIKTKLAEAQRRQDSVA